MLTQHPRTLRPPTHLSANPLALATLTCVRNGKSHLVEWTSVSKVKWTRDGSSHIRHVLDPILKEHIGFQKGLTLNLQPYDVGCRLVIDVSVDSNLIDYHVEG